MFLGLRSRPAPASQGLKIPGGPPTPAPCLIHLLQLSFPESHHKQKSLKLELLGHTASIEHEQRNRVWSMEKCCDKHPRARLKAKLGSESKLQ